MSAIGPKLPLGRSSEHVRCRGKTGSVVLAASLSGLDPSQTSGPMTERYLD